MPHDLLQPVRELIGDPEHPERWTQRRVAADAIGRPTPATDPAAVCWCLVGALKRTQEQIGRLGALAVYEEIWRRLDKDPLSGWNDDPRRRHEDVVAVLRAPFYGEAVTE